jgi:hypothetical protein
MPSVCKHGDVKGHLPHRARLAVEVDLHSCRIPGSGMAKPCVYGKVDDSWGWVVSIKSSRWLGWMEPKGCEGRGLVKLRTENCTPQRSRGGKAGGIAGCKPAGQSCSTGMTMNLYAMRM